MAMPVPRRPTAAHAAAGREQLQGVGQFGQVADAVHAVGAGQRLPAAVGGGQRTGVGGHHGPAAGRAAGGEQHTGMSRAAAEASTARSRPASRTASSTSASTRVSGRPSAYSGYSAALVTSSWPEDTATV